jgi:hypothetical protein
MAGLATVAHAQTDSLDILHAKNAIALSNCDNALNYLQMVSPDGKMTQNYFLYMAKANDCKQNNEQAIYYYKRYLEFDAGNDSVKLRVAELSDQKSQQAKAANEQRLANASYHSVSKNKRHKKKHLNIDDSYNTFGIAYDFALGGNNAPYKHGISFNWTGNYPVAHNKIILGYILNSDLLFSPNNNWFANVYELTPDQISGVDIGYNYHISFHAQVVLVNKTKMSLTAGPFIGVGMTYIPDPSFSYGGAVTSEDGVDYGLCYGLRANLHIGEVFTVFGEYAHITPTSYHTDYGGNTFSYEDNRDLLRIGIACRFDVWGWF